MCFVFVFVFRSILLAVADSSRLVENDRPSNTVDYARAGESAEPSGSLLNVVDAVVVVVVVVVAVVVVVVVGSDLLWRMAAGGGFV